MAASSYLLGSCGSLQPAPHRLADPAMTRLANGDLKIAIPGLGRDEIGEMASAVEVFKNSVTEAERLRAEPRESEQM